MDAGQLLAVYRYLLDKSPDPRKVVSHIHPDFDFHGRPIEAALYLPLFSMGIGTAAISPRLKWLRENGWDTEQLANASDCAIDTIVAAKLPTGKPFGMRNRVLKLVQRAQEIQDLGTNTLSEILKPAPSWGCRELIQPIHTLNSFTGIGRAAAWHILMDLGWGVIKPDRHVCRFLSRLGGRWTAFFPQQGIDKLCETAALPFQESWKDNYDQMMCALEGTEAKFDEMGAPQPSELSSRQIDLLIMLYTQNIDRDDRDWRPSPLCSVNPHCESCHVPNCTARTAAARI